MVRIAAAAAIVGLASAIPTGTTPNYYSLNQLARFENADGLPLVAASPINVYLDIMWNGMSLVSAPINNAPGLLFNTPSNAAAFSKGDVATVLQGQPSMTVNYPDSTIDHFDLKSFYYGCVVGSQESVVGVLQSCTVTIKGYSDFDGKNEVAEQEFSFDVQLLDLQEPMTKASVSSKFKGVKRVDFFVSNDLLTAALIDTVDYTVYSTGKIGN